MSKKKIPNLDAGYTEFKFIQDSSLQTELGETDFDKHKIAILPGLEDNVFKEVLWHEICHVIFEVAGIGGHPNDEKAVVSMTNEEMVTLFTRALILIFRLNPWLKEYLDASDP